MDADSVGQSHLIEFSKLVLDWLVVKLDDEFLSVRVNTTHVTDIPVENIHFGDGIILLDGVPFEQGSDAEQLRACLAIAMARNPELKVIRIREGSLLDEDSEKLVREIATKKGFQIWQEKVDSSGKVGFFIEEGKLKQDESNVDF